MTLSPAFADPVQGSQGTFRAVMDAMARPGTIRVIPSKVAAPSPLNTGAAAVALTLLDYETPVWLDRMLARRQEVVDWFRFHTGAPMTSDPIAAAFAFIADSIHAPDFESFSPGSMEYPDRSTTLVLQVERFSAGESLSLSGPGVEGVQRLAATPLPKNFGAQLIANRALFPRGVDVILTTDDAVAALPRSVRVVKD
jgi:alpha-D-ribose 1-methylphosphonate 5-triphosphate synthase subunit PhnH